MGVKYVTIVLEKTNIEGCSSVQSINRGLTRREAQDHREVMMGESYVNDVLMMEEEKFDACHQS